MPGLSAGAASVAILPDTSRFGAALRASMARELPIAERAAAGLGASISRVGAGISSVGTRLTRSFTLPLGLAGAASLKLALDFEGAFTRISAISNASAVAIARWRGQVLTLAGATGRSPQELANALFFLASAGLKTSQVMGALELSAKASATGLGQTEDIAKIVAQSLNAYARSGLTATQATDALVAAVKAGTAEPAEFADALGRVLPIAAKAGVSFQQVAASVAALSNIGLDADEAVTALRGVLSALEAPGSQAAKALRGVGISAQEMRAAISEEGILGALKLLQDRTGGNIDVMRRIIPNVRSLTGNFGLMGENAKTVSGIFDQVVHSNGALDKAFETTTRGPAFKMQQALANLQRVGIELGERLVPIATRVAQTFTRWADAFGRLSPQTQDMIVKIGLLAIAAGPVLRIFGGLTSTVGRLAGLWVSLGTAVSRTAGPIAQTGQQLSLFGSGLAASGGALQFLVAALPAVAIGAGLVTAAFLGIRNENRKIQDSIDANIQRIATQTTGLANVQAAIAEAEARAASVPRVGRGAPAGTGAILQAGQLQESITQYNEAKARALDYLGGVVSLTGGQRVLNDVLGDQFVAALSRAAVAERNKNKAGEQAALVQATTVKDIAVALDGYNALHAPLTATQVDTIRVAIAQGRLNDALSLVRSFAKGASNSVEELRQAHRRAAAAIQHQRAELINLNKEEGVTHSRSALVVNIQNRQAAAHAAAARQAAIERLRVLGLHGELDKLPGVKRTIIAINDLASRPLRAIQALLASISHPRNVDVLFTGGGSVPHFALGTSYAPGGVATVGEHRPETVYLPRGSRVEPGTKADRSAPLVGTLNVYGRSTPDDASETLNRLRYLSRVRGF